MTGKKENCDRKYIGRVETPLKRCEQYGHDWMPLQVENPGWLAALFIDARKKVYLICTRCGTIELKRVI